MTLKTIRALCLSLVTLLAACGDSSLPSLRSGTIIKSAGDKDAFNVYVDSLCDELGGDASVEFSTNATCMDCASESDANAIDGTDATFATLSFASLTQGPLTFRATAQPGVVYPAGSRPAVTFSAPDDVNFIRVEIRTYLQGVQQERECFQGAYFNEEDRNVFGLDATQPFDAIETSLQRTNVGVHVDCGTQLFNSSNAHEVVMPEQIRVHEFCHEFRPPN